MRSVNRFVLFTFLPVFLSVASGLATTDDPPADKAVRESRDRISTIRDEIVVTASALPETEEEAPVPVTVIDREKIEASRARDLAELLREVPGLHLARAGSPGKAASLFTRGGNSNHTLVLWNGIEINNPYFSGYDWGQFSTTGVERVEIVRGPYSALYGSDAVTGVINVFTIPSASGWDAEVFGGDRGLVAGRASGSLVSDSLLLDGAVESRRDDGWFANDDLSQQVARGGIRWAPSEAVSVGLFARYNDYEIGIPFNEIFGISELQPSLSRRQSGQELQVAMPLQGVAGALHWEATISRSEHRLDLDDPEDPFGFVFSTTRSRSNRVRLSGRSASPFGTIVAGVEAERAEVDDRSSFGTTLDGESRSFRSIFLEDRLSRSFANGILELSAGLRHDDYDSFGSASSPRLAVAWRSGLHRVRAAWGEAFRAPSVGELYFPFAGNRALRPEESRGGELGYDWTSRDMWLSITAFRTEFEELIFFDNATFSFQNIGAASSHGVELSAGRTIGPLAADVSWTWLDTEQDDTGLELLRRPQHSGSLRLQWRRDRIDASLVAVRTGSRADVLPVFPYGRIPLEPHTTVGLSAGIELGRVSPYVKLENLFDEEYEEIRGFPAPGRRAIIGLRMSH